MDPTVTDTIFAAWDVAAILEFVGTAGVAIVGIALAVKGIQYARRMTRGA